MRPRFILLLAAALCAVSCLEENAELGSNLLPIEQTFSIHPVCEQMGDIISLQTADSLSGFSQTRIVLGAIRDARFGLTTRSSAFTLLPMFDSLGIGNRDAVQIKEFSFTAKLDTISVAEAGQEHILQSVEVYALSEPLDEKKDFDCNGAFSKVDFSRKIAQGNPVLDGERDLEFRFTDAYAKLMLGLTREELQDSAKYFRKVPGIFMRTDKPLGRGGRINLLELQMGYNSTSAYIENNYATLKLACDYDNDGIPEKDTTFYFLFGMHHFMDLDSLVTNSTKGQYPQYALNLTGQEEKTFDAQKELVVEGGGGLKPVVSAKGLIALASRLIAEKGGNPQNTVINKATLVFPFTFPADYRDMARYPACLSPTCRMHQSNGTILYASLTDASSSEENQGDINRSTLRYEPDITYHLQALLKIREDDPADAAKREKLEKGEYDIWFLVMSKEEVSTSSGTSDLSEYYQYLAYQSYYNNMYGGYGGGYGGGYNDTYSNYYTYMMMAQYAAGSTTTSYNKVLDRDRFYGAVLHGWGHDMGPYLKLTFSLPKD
ncbi:MAG: hypothetical protein J5871_04880 [Bacteroidales bacterium]|nr:hypothetical protein [Bacteroidales bacterium]